MCHRFKKQASKMLDNSVHRRSSKRRNVTIFRLTQIHMCTEHKDSGQINVLVAEFQLKVRFTAPSEQVIFLK